MIFDMNSAIRRYLAKIGSVGGQRSRRLLAPDTARDMVRLREARRAFQRFHSRCFWSHDAAYKVTGGEIPWVAEQLRKYGNREAWKIAARLCR